MFSLRQITNQSQFVTNTHKDLSFLWNAEILI